MIMVIMIVLPVVLTLWGIWSAFQFNISSRTHAILNEEVARLKRGESKATVSEENRAVIESLTGLPYEQCWGQNTVGYINHCHMKAQPSESLNNI